MDNTVDADGDGVADVKQMSNKDIATRKLSLVLKTINPSKVIVCVCACVCVCVRVCARPTSACACVFT